MFVIMVRFSYIYVSQGSVKTHLWCGGIYNNHIIALLLSTSEIKLLNNIFYYSFARCF